MLFIIFLSGSAWPQDTAERRYRVELIVLMHLEHAEQAREEKWLDDFADALDFLTPPEETESEESEGEEAESQDTAADEMAENPGGTPPQGDSDASAITEAEPLEEDPFATVVYLPELGEEMQEAWRRLRLSGPFRPLQFLAWEQNGSAPFPELRIHDQEIVLTQDPWAEERAALETEEATLAQAAVTPDPGMQDAAVAGQAEEEEEKEIPPPLLYYRLDGTAQLMRSRFLHLALDIEWREPVFADVPPMPTGRVEDGAEALAPLPDAFLVYRLEQTRQVRTARMEYFDGPVLGVLARVTRVRVEEAAEADDVEPDAEWQE